MESTLTPVRHLDNMKNVFNIFKQRIFETRIGTEEQLEVTEAVAPALKQYKMYTSS